MAPLFEHPARKSIEEAQANHPHPTAVVETKVVKAPAKPRARAADVEVETDE